MSDINKVNSSIHSSIKTPEPIAKAEPAKSSCSAGTGLTSLGEGKKAPDSEVLPAAIPIFPMRYVQKWDVFSKQLKESYIPEIPTSLKSSTDYELARIRQGYIYIYFQRCNDPNPIWHIYKYVTDSMDENAGLMAEELDFVPSTPNSFVKFEWQYGKETNWTGVKITDDNEIKYPECFPYPFVPNDVEECWVAYSEYRWPEFYFLSAQEEMKFRESFMIYVDVKSKKSKHVAPLKNLKDYCSYVYSGERDKLGFDAIEEQVRNKCRYTHLVSENFEEMIKNPSALEHGVVVALFDSIGDQLDYNRLLNFANEEYEAFYEAHQHAFETGELTEKWIESGEANSSWFKPNVTDPDFEQVYGKIKLEIKERKDNIERMLSEWLKYKNRNGYFGLNRYLIRIENSFDRYSLDGSVKHWELVKFYLHEMSRPLYLVTNVALAKKMQSDIFMKMEGEIEDDKIKNDLALVEIEADRVFRSVKILEIISKFLDKKEVTIKIPPISKLVFGFYFHLFSENYARIVGKRAGEYNPKYSTSVVFDKFFYYGESVEIDSHEKAVEVFSRNFSKQARFIQSQEIIDQTRVREIMRNGKVVENELSHIKLGLAKKFKMTKLRFYNLSAGISVSKIKVSEAKNLDIFNFAEAGFGAIGGLVTIYMAAKNWSSMQETASSHDLSLVKFGLSPVGQIFGAWLDVHAAIFAIQEGRKNKILKEIYSFKGRTQIYKEVFRKIDYKVMNALFNYGTKMDFVKNKEHYALRTVSINLAKVVTRSATVYTTYLAFVAAYDDHVNNEKTSKIGNLMWGSGVIAPAMLRALRVGAPLARFGLYLSIIVIAVGLFLTFFKRNKFEKVVDNSIWGTTENDLMGVKRRILSLESRVKLTISGHMQHDYVDYMYKDLMNFYDAEYGLYIDNEKKGDGILEVFESIETSKGVFDKLEVNAIMSVRYTKEYGGDSFWSRSLRPVVKHVLLEEGEYRKYILDFNDDENFRMYEGLPRYSCSFELEVGCKTDLNYFSCSFYSNNEDV